MITQTVSKSSSSFPLAVPKKTPTNHVRMIGGNPFSDDLFELGDEESSSFAHDRPSTGESALNLEPAKKENSSSAFTIYSTENSAAVGSYTSFNTSPESSFNFSHPEPSLPTHQVTEKVTESIAAITEIGSEVTKKTVTETVKLATDTTDAWADLFKDIFGLKQKAKPEAMTEKKQEETEHFHFIKSAQETIKNLLQAASENSKAKDREYMAGLPYITQSQVKDVNINQSFDVRNLDNAHGWALLRTQALKQDKQNKAIVENIKNSSVAAGGPDFNKHRAGEQSVQSVYQTAG